MRQCIAAFCASCTDPENGVIVGDYDSGRDPTGTAVFCPSSLIQFPDLEELTLLGAGSDGRAGVSGGICSDGLEITLRRSPWV